MKRRKASELDWLLARKRRRGPADGRDRARDRKIAALLGLADADGPAIDGALAKLGLRADAAPAVVRAALERRTA